MENKQEHSGSGDNIAGNKIIINNYPLPQKDKTAVEHFSEGLEFLQMNPPNTEKALICFAMAIGLKPDYIDAYVERGCIRMKQKDYDAAIKNFKDAIYSSPNITSKHCDAIYHLAVSFIEIKEFERATNWLEKSKEIGCNKRNHEIDELLDKLYSKCTNHED